MSKVLLNTLINKLRRKTISKVHTVGMKTETCEIYNCLRKILRLCRWFGFFPVDGLESSSITDLRFNMKNLYGVYAALTALGQTAMAVLTLYKIITNELSLTFFAHFLFNGSSFFSTIFLLILARNWPSLVKEISSIEKQLTDIKLKKNTPTKINAFCFFILFLGLVEHLLCLIHVITFVKKCLDDSTFSYAVMIMYFTLKTTIPTSDMWTGVILEISNIQATFLWTVTDVLIMSMSMYLASYFIEFNKLINSAKFKKSTNWGHLRMQYSHLVKTVKKIDAQITYMVLASFFTNLCFSCLQLFNVLTITELDTSGCNQESVSEARHGIEYSLYYSFSSMFMITRTVSVSLLAANVNAYAYEPIGALGEVHASAYNMEIQRFYRQLSYSTIGLRGVFFYVTRPMIVKVLGTLITYELVLLQFDKIYDNSGMGNTSILLKNHRPF